MSKLPQREREDLALQMASMLYEQLPKRKRRKAAKYFKSNNDDTFDIWSDCLKQAAIMIDHADYKLDRYLESDKI